jgi:hypothetical protein
MMKPIYDSESLPGRCVASAAAGFPKLAGLRSCAVRIAIANSVTVSINDAGAGEEVNGMSFPRPKA